MRVLIVSQYFWPESFRINEVAQSIVGRGCEVTVLTGKPNYPEGEIFSGYRMPGVQCQEHEGSEIVRVPVLPRGRGSATRLVLNYLSFVLCAGILGAWALRGRRFDVIFVYGISPILQVVPAIWLKRVKRAALVTWVQDLWPESLELTGFVRNKRVLALVGWLVRWIYRRCDLLLVQSRAFLVPVRAMAGTTPVEYHPNPGAREASVEAEPAENSLQLKPGFNVVFAGNLGTVQALDTVLDAAELLGEEPGIRWVLVGSGSRSDWLEAQVEARGLTNVELPGRFESAVMPSIFAQADILLVSLIKGQAMSVTIPSKVQAYLAAGRPIVASLDGEGARIVEESGAGLACAAEDPQALAMAVQQIKEMDPERRNAMGAAGRQYYDLNFSPERLAQALVAYFHRAIDAKEKH